MTNFFHARHPRRHDIHQYRRRIERFPAGHIDPPRSRSALSVGRALFRPRTFPPRIRANSSRENAGCFRAPAPKSPETLNPPSLLPRLSAKPSARIVPVAAQPVKTLGILGHRGITAFPHVLDNIFGRRKFFLQACVVFRNPAAACYKRNRILVGRAIAYFIYSHGSIPFCSALQARIRSIGCSRANPLDIGPQAGKPLFNSFITSIYMVHPRNRGFPAIGH